MSTEFALSDAAAHLRRATDVFAAVCGPSQSRPNEGSPAHAEHEEASRLGLDGMWVTELFTVVLGLTRAAVEHASAAATLLDNRQTSSIPLLARAAIEHSQRACWLLAPAHVRDSSYTDRVTARQRAARAQLIELDGLEHACAALRKLRRGGGDPALAAVRYCEVGAELQARKAAITAAFGEGIVVTGANSGWVIEQQRLTSLTRTSEWYFETLTPGDSGRGVYDALSSWSHPSIVGIRERFEWLTGSDGGGMCVPSDMTDLISRIAPTTCSTLHRNLIQVAAYFGWDEAAVERWGIALKAWTPGLLE